MDLFDQGPPEPKTVSKNELVDEINDELRRTRLDKTRLYNLLLRVVEYAEVSEAANSRGPPGPRGPAGPAGPAGPRGDMGPRGEKGQCTCQPVSLKVDEPKKEETPKKETPKKVATKKTTVKKTKPATDPATAA
jgi:hypothetical protein